MTGDELIEVGLGAKDATVERALGLVLRRVFAESALSPEGPWAMACEASVDLVESRVSLSIELSLLPEHTSRSAFPAATAGGLN